MRRVRKPQFVFLSLAIIILFASCSKRNYTAMTVKFEPPVDTRSRDIEFQEKKGYSFNDGSISFDNLFDGARLNNCTQNNDSTFTVSIKAENYPINMSPWYSFRIVSKIEQHVYVNIEYDRAKHRYIPKLSTDSKLWTQVDARQFSIYDDTSGIAIDLNLKSDTTWISAQELEPSSKVMDYWTKSANVNDFSIKTVGKSKVGTPIIMLDLYNGEKKGKPVIAVLSRQHPPEITGYYAMIAFINRILEGDKLANDFLDNYRVLVFPLINPDGVDLGHWRHNTGGIDLNRDWGIYHQPEVRIVADRLVFETKSNKSDLVLGIDFHSTSRDIYYTTKVDTNLLKIGNFKDRWLKAHNMFIPAESYKESTAKLGNGLTSHTWFFRQFKAVGITYEVGDNRPRNKIKFKAEVSAKLMMHLLLEDHQKLP